MVHEGCTQVGLKVDLQDLCLNMEMLTDIVEISLLQPRGRDKSAAQRIKRLLRYPQNGESQSWPLDSLVVSGDSMASIRLRGRPLSSGKVYGKMELVWEQTPLAEQPP